MSRARHRHHLLRRAGVLGASGATCRRALVPHAYVRQVERGRRPRRCVVPPRAGRRRGRRRGVLGAAGRPDPRRRRRRRPGPLRRRAAPARPGAAAGPRRASSSRSRRGAGRAGPAAARHLPRHAGDGGRGRRRRWSSTCPTGSGTTGTRRAPGVYGTHPVRTVAGHAAWRGCSASGSTVAELPPPVGADPPRLRRRGLGRRRHAGGDGGPGRDGSGSAVQWHPEDGRGPAAVRGARRGGAHAGGLTRRGAGR